MTYLIGAVGIFMAALFAILAWVCNRSIYSKRYPKTDGEKYKLNGLSQIFVALTAITIMCTAVLVKIGP